MYAIRSYYDQRGLADAVAAEEAGDLAGFDLEGEAAEDVAAAVVLVEVFDFEHLGNPHASWVSERPGFACRRGTFFCLAKRKYPKKTRARCVARLRRVLCAARPQRGAAELGPLALRQSSPFFPLRPALLDDAEGNGKTERIFLPPSYNFV